MFVCEKQAQAVKQKSFVLGNIDWIQIIIKIITPTKLSVVKHIIYNSQLSRNITLCTKAKDKTCTKIFLARNVALSIYNSFNKCCSY